MSLCETLYLNFDPIEFVIHISKLVFCKTNVNVIKQFKENKEIKNFFDVFNIHDYNLNIPFH